MSQGFRIAAVSVMASIAVGVVVGSVVVVLSEPQERWQQLLTGWSDLAALTLIAGFASLPVSLPAGIAGGIFAAKTFTKHAAVRSTSDWLAAGSIWGATIGVISTWIVYGWASIGSDNPLGILLVFGANGAVAGAAVGLLVGGYCACAGRRSVIARV